MQNDELWMKRALELAKRGRGSVEPNPMVGCVIVKDGQLVGEGFHQRCGEAHAEVNALREAGDRAAGATVYVTLEPCCHFGKTPPCADALIQAKVARVVVAMQDPFSKVNGGGLEKLRNAGIETCVGVLEAEALELNAPYLKLILCRRPFVTAKWAMTLDGKIATRTRSSRWVSNELSRERVQQLRSCADAILVGSGTVVADNPSLTVRLENPKRTPLRIVADDRLETPLLSTLVQTAREVPTLLLIGPGVPEEATTPYRDVGCEILRSAQTDHAAQLLDLLDELGKRRMTNLLVEGGSEVLGALLDVQEIDAVEIFMAPKLVGGREAVTPIAGFGLPQMEKPIRLNSLQMETLDGDIHVSARVEKQNSAERYEDFDPYQA